MPSCARLSTAQFGHTVSARVIQDKQNYEQLNREKQRERVLRSRRVLSKHLTQYSTNSPAPAFPSQTFMHQHLQQSLVADSFSLGDFSSLSDIRLWQPDGNLHTLPLPAQLVDQGRTSRSHTFRMLRSRFPLHIASPCRASPPLCFVTFGLKLRYLYRSPRHSLCF